MNKPWIASKGLHRPKTLTALLFLIEARSILPFKPLQTRKEDNIGAWVVGQPCSYDSTSSSSLHLWCPESTSLRL
ncbi:uncharacterized protein ARMOST_15766 [Armillaria ostoyae]|uniref:Uncharacterized protein n=1 Tax=Armillaria ostoyae TaxID=47428 RepID=A0A284RUE5_ARMOS|nr:uncharacterized protein ARMOST_15766 [Armillaria ostoyae]